MNESDTKDLWNALDCAILGTDDPNTLRKLTFEGGLELQRREKTFGGFLSLLRWRREQRVSEIARQAKVSEEQWDVWESDLTLPSGLELAHLMENLKLGERHRSQLQTLWSESPFRRLVELAHFRPQLLAARGAAATSATLEWERLPLEVQVRLERWARAQSYTLPEQLFEMLESLAFESDGEREEWAHQVWTEL